MTVQGSVMTSNMISPKVRLNGYPVASHYGENVFPVPPGAWHIDVECIWVRTYGRAALDVDVVEGQTVDTFYAPPYHQFSGGRLGLERQKRAGPGIFVAILAVALAVIVIGIVASLL
ncbi:hypothetical protein GCM10009795_002220 [Nocardioides hankookensis]